MSSISWIELVQSGFIVAGFTLSALSFRNNNRSRRIQNLLALTKAHREIWSQFQREPELLHSIAKIPDKTSPEYQKAELKVRELLLHLATSYEAIKYKQIQQDGIKQDIRDFFALAFPRQVWTRIKQYQNKDFVRFVDATIQEKKMPQ